MSILTENIVSNAGKEIFKSLNSAIAGLFEPYQIRRLAKANDQAARLKIDTESYERRIKVRDSSLEELAKAETKILSDKMDHSQLSTFNRASKLFFHELLVEQTNLEIITSEAFNRVEEDLENKEKSSPIDDDWMFRFVKYAKEVNNADIQDLWSSILAEKAKGDLDFSMHTLDVLRKMTREEILSFIKYCRLFNYYGYIIVHEPQLGYNLDSVTEEMLLAFGEFQKLRDIGLLYETRMGISIDPNSLENLLPLGGELVKIKANYEDIVLEPQRFVLTSSGEELTHLVTGYNSSTVGGGTNHKIQGEQLSKETIDMWKTFTLRTLEESGFSGSIAESNIKFGRRKESNNH